MPKIDKHYLLERHYIEDNKMKKQKNNNLLLWLIRLMCTEQIADYTTKKENKNNDLPKMIFKICKLG